MSLIRFYTGCLLSLVFLFPRFSNAQCSGTSVLSDAKNITCNGAKDGSIRLSQSFIAINTPYQYSINNGAFTTDSVFNNLSPGVYNLRVRNSIGCIETLTPINVTEPTALSFVTDSVFAACGNNGIARVSVSGGTPPYAYLWNNFPPSFTDSAENLSPGIYKVLVSDLNACVDSIDVTVNGDSLFAVTINPSSATIDFGSSIDLSASVNNSSAQISYSWLPAQYLSCSTCQNTTAAPIRNATYVVLANDFINKCVASDTVDIELTGTPNVFFPTAFTPNNDGTNDVFKVYGLGIDNVSWYILDERGFRLYDGIDTVNGWDGTQGSSKSPAGLYFYHAEIEFVTGEKQTIRGQFNLIR